LPGFAYGGQQTELNQTLSNGTKVNRANNLPQKFSVIRLKNWGRKQYTFGRSFNDFET